MKGGRKKLTASSQQSSQQRHHAGNQSESIAARIYAITKTENPTELAKFLRISRQAASQGIQKEQPPLAWLMEISERCKVSLDWLAYGDDDHPTKGLNLVRENIPLYETIDGRILLKCYKIVRELIEEMGAIDIDEEKEYQITLTTYTFNRIGKVDRELVRNLIKRVQEGPSWNG